MARLSIKQTMLALSQVQSIPAIARALPAFDLVLSKYNLYSSQDRDQEPTPRRSLLDQEGQGEASLLSPTPSSMNTSQIRAGGYPLLTSTFLGFDFLDRWDPGQLGPMGVCWM